MKDLKLTLTQSELENEIVNLINYDNVNSCTVEFRYIEESNGVTLNVVTNNPTHSNTFLFEQSWGISKEVALIQLINRLSGSLEINQNNYTVSWEIVGGTTQTSYFRGKDIYEVLDKFYHDKNKKNYIIFEIKLNPQS